ncbi:MAG: DUF4153 domain-containing protein [Balneola sp.]
MKIYIPSVSELTVKSTDTLKRFPFAILLAFVGTFSGMWYAGLSFSDQSDLEWLFDLIMISFLGISFLVGIKVYSESRDLDGIKAVSVGILGIILLALYYTIPADYISSGVNEYGYRFFLLALITHLAVSFAPFIHNKNVEGFWEYNKTLFLNILTSALYSAVLFAGLSIALLSIDNLLGFDIKDERYLQLWIFMVGIFNTLFFLSRFPKKNELSQPGSSYPKALKVFVQYVLIPLVTVYILILYSYLIKIIIQWELPNGWVANLVLSFSIAGIFSLLLLHPIKDEVKNSWIRLYSKLYYFALVPLVMLLFVSIGTRIAEYGVTINRFLVATLAVWLAGIVIYFIFSKAKNIKVIPISLGLIALGITFGPMSAFSVSERSQRGRVIGILETNNQINENGKITKSENVVGFTDRAEISSIVRYLIDNHGLNSLQLLFQGDLESSIDPTGTGELDFQTKSEKIVELMGLNYVDAWETENSETLNQNRFYEYTSEPKTGIDITKYEFSFNGLQFFSGTSEVPIKAGERILKLHPDLDEYTFTIKTENDTNLVQLSFLETLKDLQKNYSGASSGKRIPAEMMIISTENEYVSAMMAFHSINGKSGVDGSISNVQFTLYLTIK